MWVVNVIPLAVVISTLILRTSFLMNSNRSLLMWSLAPELTIYAVRREVNESIEITSGSVAMIAL